MYVPSPIDGTCVYAQIQSGFSAIRQMRDGCGTHLLFVRTGSNGRRLRKVQHGITRYCGHGVDTARDYLFDARGRIGLRLRRNV